VQKIKSGQGLPKTKRRIAACDGANLYGTLRHNGFVVASDCLVLAKYWRDNGVGQA
jgi:hypothetical protein